jgi:hypothetical protein
MYVLKFIPGFEEISLNNIIWKQSIEIKAAQQIPQKISIHTASIV